MGKHFVLKNNQVFVLAEAAGGVYNSDQLRILCEIAESESAFLKVTEDQRIGFMTDPTKLPDIQAQVRKIGLLLKSYKAPGVPSPRACLGELCTYSLQPSLSDALELTTHLLKTFPAPKHFSSIGVNGCGQACLGSSTEDVHIVAEESGYKISIGGKKSELPQHAQLLVENVARTDLPAVVEKLLDVYYKESDEGEQIYDVIDRVGLTPFLNVLPEHLSVVSNKVNANTFNEIDHSIDGDLNPQEILQNELSSDDSKESNLSTNALIDDLLDSASQEFPEIEGHNGLVNIEAELDPQLLKEDDFKLNSNSKVQGDKISQISAPKSEESTSMESNLLDEAEFEDGTLEDVERVRDAIRSELSMTASDDLKSMHSQIDLLDEIDQEQQISDRTSPDLITEALLEDESASESDMTIERQQLIKATQFHSEAVSRENLNREKNNSVRETPETQAAVSGRLAIKFEGEQLGIELPSGMCFELPFDAVPEGNELSMILPDGEMRMEREGSFLNVKLGMLNMRFPIPSVSRRRAA